MIQSFKHKGLKELFISGSTAKLPPDRLNKIKKVLAAISAARDIKDLRIPAFRLHRLEAPPFNGFWSIDVTGNYRIIFRFEDGDALDVHYLDTH